MEEEFGGRVWRESLEGGGGSAQGETDTTMVSHVESKMTLKLQNKDTHNTYIAISIQHETETLQLHTVHMTAQQLEPTTHTHTHAHTQPHGLRHYVGTRNSLVTLQ